MKILTVIILAGTAVGVSAQTPPVDWSKLPPAATTPGVTFAKDIEPMLKESCVRCHSGDRPRAQLRLDTLEGVMKGVKQGPIVNAGDSANSLLVKAVSQLDPKSAMPPKPRARRGGLGGTNAPAMPPGGPMAGGPGGGGPPVKPLTAEQVGLVRAWIDQGAK
ncbi:MAG TPA: c-type cytochrome domain-containing protein [Verrucomicrobiae bacterium]